MTRVQKAVSLAVTLAMILSLSSCIAYTTNGQGQLQSIGVPGVPIWQTKAMSSEERLAAQGRLAATPGGMVDSSAASLVAVKSDAPWLAEVNRWRTEAGVQPVGENNFLDLSTAYHARYLVKNGPRTPLAFMEYANTLDAAAHTEDATSPYFTQDGYEAALRGDISWDRNPIADVDGLVVEAPFHRFSILAPWIRVAGYGAYGKWPMRAATLEMRGSTPVGLAKTVLFPPDGSTVKGIIHYNEWPSPLAACPGYSLPIGTPITVQTGAFVKVELKSYSVTDESTGRAVQACGFDALTYPIPHGQQVLMDYGAVVVVPRHPLLPGHTYSVHVQTLRHTFDWSFHVKGENPTLTSASREHG